MLITVEASDWTGHWLEPYLYLDPTPNLLNTCWTFRTNHWWTCRALVQRRLNPSNWTMMPSASLMKAELTNNPIDPNVVLTTADVSTTNPTLKLSRHMSL